MSLPTETPPAAAHATLEPATGPGESPRSQTAPSNPLRVLYPTLLDAARSFASILIIAIFILTFIVQPFRIPSESMERTLLVGDFMLVNKSIYGPPGHFGWLLPYRPVRRGDIAVFYFPLNPAEHVVKRVIGVPGDRIHLVHGIVYRNGKPLTEPYAVEEPSFPDPFRDNFPAGPYTNPDVDTHWWTRMHHDEVNGNVVVPPGDYFVLGDNRKHSRDSRYWGFVPRANIVGRPLLIYFSLREPSATDIPALPQARAMSASGGKLNQEGPLEKIFDFARWSRILQVIH
ncbi:MAG TPA: signal peptidase I [Acidobacteriaceae bacterium]|nr:signal peptidase I [Acidobacteriaceae bacterium]